MPTLQSQVVKFNCKNTNWLSHLAGPSYLWTFDQFTVPGMDSHLWSRPQIQWESRYGYLPKSCDCCTNEHILPGVRWKYCNISFSIALLNSLMKSAGLEVLLREWFQITFQFLKYMQGSLWYLFFSCIYMISAFTKLRRFCRDVFKLSLGFTPLLVCEFLFTYTR